MRNSCFSRPCDAFKETGGSRSTATAPRRYVHGLASLACLAALTLPLTAAPDRQLGPSSRRTPLTISEIHYHPAETPFDNTEFVELFNTEPVPIDLSGFRLRGEADFTFPPGTVLPALSFLVVAADPASLMAQHAITNVIGPLTNRLANAGGTIQLDNRWGATLLEVPYADQPPWPIAADGAGHSLVLARPDFGEASPLAWSASRAPGGSPGTADPTNRLPQHAIVINEWLAHSDPALDRIELYNTATQTVDLSACFLCDDPLTACYPIPPGTLLPPGGFLALDEVELGFRLNASGDDVFLLAPDGTTVLDAARFGPQSLALSSGRHPDGAPDIVTLSQPTFGAPNTNAAILRSPVIINEIMFRSLAGLARDEYVELLNRSSNTVDLSHWQFTAGIRFSFPPNTTLAPGDHLVIARDRDHLISRYLHLNTANTLGNFSGELSDRGERIALAKPHNPALPLQDLVVMDALTYGDGAEWGDWIDSGGSSLELTDPHSDSRLAANWVGSDESQKSLWTTIEHTGVLDNGSGSLEELDVYLMNAGECLVDNIELIRQGESLNRVAPSTFEAGLDGWTPLGNHVRSTRAAAVGDGGGAALHLRASGPGRTTTSSYLLGHFDRIWKPISPAPQVGEVYTIRARARWLRGWPYLAVSLKGFWLEAAGPLHVPTNLGTPGLPNSRLLANAPPAIHALEVAPLLPAPNQPVTVTCRVHDPDGIAAVELHYRLDPATNYLTLAMAPEAPGGTGRYIATIPGQPDGTLVGFYVTARDAAPAPAERACPDYDLIRNALVRFGEPPPAGAFGTYTYWVSDANVKALASRSNQSNEPVDATFVYNGTRAIHNVQLRYRGNFRRFSSITNAAYALVYPAGERFLGDRESKIDIPSLQFSNGTRQQERHSYTIAAAIGYPASTLRYVRTRINGAELFRHDLQPPTRDFAQSWYGDDDAFIHKEEKPLDPFDRYTTTGGRMKQSAYSFIMQRNRTTTPDYEFGALYRLVNALAQTNAATYVARVAALADLRDWSAYFAVNRAAGNEDSYGYGASFLHNMYAYLPAYERSHLHLYDMDSAFTAMTTNLFPGSEYPIVQRLLRTPAFERIYWRVLQELANGPMRAAASDAQLDAWHAAFTQDGLAFNSPDAIDPNTGKSMRQWIADRRALILGQLAATNASVAFALTGNAASDHTTTNAFVTLTGIAPVTATSLQLNGLPLRHIWLTPTAWQAQLGLHPGPNHLQLTAHNEANTEIGADTVTITFTPATEPWTPHPQGADGLRRPSETHRKASFLAENRAYGGRGSTPADPRSGTPSRSVLPISVYGTTISPVGHICISELMPNPTTPRAEFIECFNRSFSESVDLGGCRFEGVTFTFPHGTILAPRTALVVAESVPAYTAAYTNAEVLAGAYAGNLANEGETLRLWAPTANGGETLVDSVTYADALPWPTAAAGPGSALQRIDLDQPGHFPANWRAVNPDANAAWTYATVSGVATNASPPIMSLAELAFFTDGPGHVLVDRVSLVTGTVAEAGMNRVQNGDFETGALTPWLALGNHSRARVQNGIDASNTQALIIDATDAGSAGAHAVKQSALGLIANRPYTLSFWYFATNGAPDLHVRVSQTSIHHRQPTAPPAPALPLATPGLPNAGAATLPPLPTLWINEVMPHNTGSALDNAGEPEPWIELWNASTSRLELTGLTLGTNPAAPHAWTFPESTFIEPNNPLLIWADAQTNQSTSGALHAGFRLDPPRGVVVLAMDFNGEPLILDALAYENLAANTSFGSTYDGDTAQRQQFLNPTPAMPNSTTLAPLPVTINEWMADNTLIPDPSDGRKQDWFELFNPNPAALNLAGYRLTDTPAEPAPFVIPDGTWIPAKGFLVVWADNQPNQNQPGAPLHVNFQLNKDGETLALFGPDGSQMDIVTFGPQPEDISDGRWPDGEATRFRMLEPTPGASNRVLRIVNTTPTNATFAVAFASVTGRVYRLDATPHLAPSNWIPLATTTAHGPLTTVLDPASTTLTQRFYRISPLPQ